VLGALWLGTGPSLEGPKDQGIGGTGVFGLLTGFGSIFVNGLEIQIDPSQSAPSDADDTAPQPLRVGQVVRVVASANGSQLQAVSVGIEHEVIGPIDSVDADASRIVILGQTVDVADVAAKADLAQGQWAAVAGFRDGADVIHASLIEPAPEGRFQVIGEADKMPDFAASAIAAAKLSGRITVRGTLVDGEAKVSSVALWSYFDPKRPLKRLSIEGYFDAAVGRKVDARGETIRADLNGDVDAGLDVVTAVADGADKFIIVAVTEAKKKADAPPEDARKKRKSGKSGR
jgi:hypothetical protein